MSAELGTARYEEQNGGAARMRNQTTSFDTWSYHSRHRRAAPHTSSNDTGRHRDDSFSPPPRRPGYDEASDVPPAVSSLGGRMPQRAASPGPPPRFPPRNSNGAVTSTSPVLHRIGSMQSSRAETDTGESAPSHRRSWDSDGQFPIYEIQRIRRKAEHLRHSRGEGKETIMRSNHDDGFPLPTTPPSPYGVSARKRLSQRTWSSSGDTTAGSHSSPSQYATNNSVQPSDERSRASTSVGDVLDRNYSMQTAEDSGDQQFLPSDAARSAQRNLMRDFESPAKNMIRRDGQDTTPTTVGSDDGLPDDDVEYDLILHDLCGEAVSQEDVAWRNALHSLSTQPLLARVIDKDGGFTPMHICCLGETCAPTFMLRALLYVFPEAVRIPDQGGRLPLHLVAALSADVTALEWLVQAYPAAICAPDLSGLTPLHLLLRNRSVELSPERLRILLGWTLSRSSRVDASAQRSQSRLNQHVTLRRGEHLELDIASLENWRTQPLPTTVFHRDLVNEPEFELFPTDVQLALRKLCQWKHRNGNRFDNEEEQLDEEPVGNPASVPDPDTQQLPIRMLVQRGIVNPLPIQRSLSSDPEEAIALVAAGSREDHDENEIPTFNTENKVISSTHNLIESLRILAAAYPDGLTERDADGLTPLLAVMAVTDSLPSFDVVETLLGKRSATYIPLPAWARDMNLRGGEGVYRNAAMIPSASTGQLPLHVASEEMLADMEILSTIHDSYPGAINIQDDRGRTPLHIALNSYRRTPTNTRALVLLFSDRVAQIRDDEGKLPFDLLLENANNFPTKAPRSRTGSDRNDDIEHCDLKFAYRKFFHASLIGAAQPASTGASRELLQRLTNLPPWIRKEACSISFVRDMIIDEMSDPWKTAIVLFDGACLVTLLIVFRKQVDRYQAITDDQSGELSSWFAFLVYALASFRLFVQLMFWSLRSAVNKTRHFGPGHYVNFVDAIGMLTTLLTSAALYGTWEETVLVSFSAASTGFLWLALICYLSSWWQGMSVFIGGLLEIISQVFWSMLTAFMLLFAAAQTSFTLLYFSCDEESSSLSSVCDKKDAFRYVYYVFRGEAPSDLSEETSREATSLMVIFGFFLFTFTVAVCVYVLLGVSTLNFDQIATDYFWEPKMAYVFVHKEITVMERKEFGFYSTLARTWDALTFCWTRGRSAHDDTWYNIASRTKWIGWMLGLLSVLVVPLWLCLGCVTMGLLWPPQVRRWIFQPSFCGIRNDALQRKERVSMDLYDTKQQVARAKELSLERTIGIEKELKGLKELLLAAMKED